MSGYLDDEAATAEAFAGGWLHTGEVLVEREDDTLSYVDRKKYLIKTGGENVYPAEVEAVIAGHDAVQEVCVIGVPDEHWHRVVAHAEGVQALSLGPGDLTGRGTALRVSLLVVLDEGLPVCVTRPFDRCSNLFAGVNPMISASSSLRSSGRLSPTLRAVHSAPGLRCGQALNDAVHQAAPAMPNRDWFAARS